MWLGTRFHWTTFKGDWMETFSEAMHRALERRSCPNMCACQAAITKDFFSRICHSEAYINCHHFARQVGELITPMSWLQRLAVEECRQTPQSVGDAGQTIRNLFRKK
jgi:hypothetical protein